MIIFTEESLPSWVPIANIISLLNDNWVPPVPFLEYATVVPVVNLLDKQLSNLVPHVNTMHARILPIIIASSSWDITVVIDTNWNRNSVVIKI